EQKAIYYIAGGNEATLRQSPLLEFYKEKGIEVLILDEQVDDIVFGSAGEYQKLPFKAVNRADAADELKSAGDKEKEKLSAPVAEKVKAALGARVKDVKVSSRLTESPACITLDAQEPGAHIRAMMKMMGHAAPGELTPILEINPNHAIVTKLSITEDQALITDISFLLLEQAMLLEGVELQEPAEFVRRLNRVMSRAS
ncbi:MAG TPA: molecular chaperone HtpG, partial [bacterium]|nr:molecular chaperone HtpG [bacterium]